MAAPDIKLSAYVSREVDRAIESASRSVERLCHRTFYPYTGTKSFDWPNAQNARSGRLWLDGNELVELTSVQSPLGTAIDVDNVFLEPSAYGPPYNRIELNRGTTAAFSIDGSEQRSIVIGGVWAGCPITEEPAGTLSSSVSSSATTITGTSSYGVGDILRIGSERLLVTEKAWSASTQTLQNVSGLAAAANVQSVTVTDNSVYRPYEEILIDSERMLVTDLVGSTTILVRRSSGGSSLAAHANAAPIYLPRTLTVVRGALGTTAASHTGGDTAVRYLPPGPIEELARAYATNSFMQGAAAYARTIGQGENERAMGKVSAVKELEDRVYDNYGRKFRMRAV